MEVSEQLLRYDMANAFWMSFERLDLIDFRAVTALEGFKCAISSTTTRFFSQTRENYLQKEKTPKDTMVFIVDERLWSK